MTVLTGIFTLLKFLPEVVSFVKMLSGLVESGIDKVTVMQAIKRIDGAFKDPDPIARARRINDAFRL